MISKVMRVQQVERGWWILTKATLILPCVALGVRLLGFQRTRGWIGLISGQADTSQLPHRLDRAQDISLLVNAVAARLPIKYRCLVRSLVIWKLLLNEGIESQLHIGVRATQTVADPLSAHAWVTCEGAVLNDSPEVQVMFAPITTYTARPKDNA